MAARAAGPGPVLEKPDESRRGGITAWAAVGIVWTIIAVQAIVRWFFSDTFTPAPILGPDEMADWRMVALRIFQVISAGVMVGFIWFCVINPWRRTGRLSLDGKFVLGGIILFAADAFLNVHHYLFAWNSHNVDMGVWVSFLPFHSEGAPSSYAEDLLWAPPMYVYFCAGVALMGCHTAKLLRRRYPNITNVKLFSLVWVGEFIFDFVIENVVIRTTHAYSWAKTYEPLTLWPGEVYQFPIYESIFVATVGLAFTWLRMSSLEDPDGLSPVERGYQNVRPAFQPLVRTFAVFGVCTVILLSYHLAVNWLGVIGDSIADLPSYLRPSW